MRQMISTLRITLWLSSLVMLPWATVADTVIAINSMEPGPLMNSTSDNPADWSGYEWDIIQALCDPETGYLSDCTYLKTTNINERLEVLQNGTADVSLSGIGVTKERCDQVQCVHPYYYDYSFYLYTTAENVDSIKSYESIKGAKVCAFAGASYQQALDDLGFTVVDNRIREEALEKINNGECLALVAGAPFAFMPEWAIRVDLPSFLQIPITAAVANDANPALVASLQAGLTSLFQEGSESPVFAFEKTHFVDPGLQNPDKMLAQQVSAISAFVTKTGREGAESLPDAFGKEFAGISSGEVFNITIAMWKGNQPPFNTLTERDGVYRARGIEGDLIRELCVRPAINCGGDAVFGDTIDERFQALEQGLANISVGAIIVDNERLARIPFITPFYYSGGLGLYTSTSKKPLYQNENSAEFLSGLSVCSEDGSAWIPVVESTGASVQAFPSVESAVQAVEGGECELFAGDSNTVIPGLEQIPFVLPSTVKPYGIAISQDAPPALYSELSAAMISMLDDGSNSTLVRIAEKNAKDAGVPVDPNLETVANIITRFVYDQSNTDDQSGTTDNIPPAAAGAAGLAWSTSVLVAAAVVLTV